MRYLLDTNICIHAIKHNAAVMSRMRNAGQDKLCLNTIVVAELAFSVARSADAHREKNRLTLHRFLGSLEALPWPAEAGWIYGAERQRLKAAGTPIGELDLLIGAHAVAEGLTLVTNNTREFERIEGLRLEDWTTA